MTEVWESSTNAVLTGRNAAHRTVQVLVSRHLVLISKAILGDLLYRMLALFSVRHADSEETNVLAGL